MRKNLLWKTNIFLCCVVLSGFLATSIISYNSNKGIFRKDVERISALTSESVYHQIDSYFTKPVNVSRTMANSRLLKDFLQKEELLPDEESFIRAMRDYLMGYRERYRYDSVFLVSTRTGRYYHFNGLDRTMTPENPENAWYYRFIEADGEYCLNVDNDEAAEDEITVFVNARIEDGNGGTMGIVGVGFRVDDMQTLLKEYENRFGIRALLIDRRGTIEISTERNGHESVNLFEDRAYPELRQRILEDGDESGAFWHPSREGNGYLVYRYIPTPRWHLIIEDDMAALKGTLDRQLLDGIVITVLVTAFVLFTVTRAIRGYDARIVALTAAQENERRNLFREETAKLYEDIYELDVTRNRAGNKATESYFESLGLPGDAPFDQALELVAAKHVKEEFREEYIRIFSPAHVREAFDRGESSLRYDLMFAGDGRNYYWMRITARIYCWKEDRSIRMLTYRQNIDEEKRQESRMVEKLQNDSLSGLYNQATTQHKISALLAENPSRIYAFFILDIDNFKNVNDTCGHAVGDRVITDFARILKSSFRADDVVGRIGGDEFAVFVTAPSREWVENKAANLVSALHHRFEDEETSCPVSASIGISIVPEGGRDFESLYRNADIALYRTKKQGKNGYTIYGVE